MLPSESSNTDGNAHNSIATTGIRHTDILPRNITSESLKTDIHKHFLHLQNLVEP